MESNLPRITTEQDIRNEKQRLEEFQFLAQIQGEIAQKFAKNNYCVMNKERTTIVKDPGLNRPFHTPHKNRAEQVANQVGGVAETLHDALQYIMNHLGKKVKKGGD
jgi:hypothetical protein